MSYSSVLMVVGKGGSLPYLWFPTDLDKKEQGEALVVHFIASQRLKMSAELRY